MSSASGFSTSVPFGPLCSLSALSYSRSSCSRMSRTTVRSLYQVPHRRHRLRERRTSAFSPGRHRASLRHLSFLRALPSLVRRQTHHMDLSHPSPLFTQGPPTSQTSVSVLSVSRRTSSSSTSSISLPAQPALFSRTTSFFSFSTNAWWSCSPLTARSTCVRSARTGLSESERRRRSV